MTAPARRAPLLRPRVSRLWWLHRGSYLLFVLRELSSVFVAWSIAFLLLLVDAVFDGPEPYREFRAWSESPWVFALMLVTLAFVLLHAVTWFTLAPKALALRVRGQRIPPRMVAAAHFAAWAAVSVVVAWILLGGS
jgi:fumarate reductase subunit C